jgi:conjugal transfer/entry exclusion protein
MTLAEQLKAEGYEQGIQQARTLGEQLRAEGYEQGIQQARTLGEQLRAEGYEQGIQHEKTLLSRQLTRRFGPLPSESLLKLEQADAETLLVWGERIFDAKTLEEIFGE